MRNMDIRHTTAFFNLVSFAVTMVTMDSQDFHLINNDKETISPLGRSWRSDSRLACTVACFKIIPQCNSFIYNIHNSSCTLGSQTIVVQNSRNVTRQLLYTYSEPFCENSQGFSLYSNINGTVCFWVSPPGVNKNYTDANKYCRGQRPKEEHTVTQDKNLQLVTMKTVKKFYLFLDTVKMLNISFNFWIGLNDIDKEDTFKWTDDNSTMLDSVRAVLFHQYEPLNVKEEDCVEYSVSRSPCNDARCNLEQRFACEALHGE